MNYNAMFVEVQLVAFSVNFRKLVIFQMYLNYVFVKNAVKKKMLLTLIGNQQTRNSQFLTPEILKNGNL